jgi:hypothetical protein
VTEPSLVVVCATAFAAVVVLLSFLAGVIRLLSVAFPHREERFDAAVLAAITTAAAVAYPGSEVTAVEENR